MKYTEPVHHLGKCLQEAAAPVYIPFLIRNVVMGAFMRALFRLRCIHTVRRKVATKTIMSESMADACETATTIGNSVSVGRVSRSIDTYGYAMSRGQFEPL